MLTFSIGNIKARRRRPINGLIGVPIMNISENIPKENGRKKMRRSLLGKIEGRGIGISAKMSQIKTTAKKSFLFFCSFLIIATGILCPVAIDVYAEAVPPLPEGFNDIDLSDILITFPTGAGAGISNETVLNDLYSHYGVSGWGVGDMTPYFDIVVTATGESAGLSNEVLNQHLGDNEWFQQNGYDIKVNYESFKSKLDATESLTHYGANYIHQATLSPSTGNPWEWDWSSILEEYFRTGLIGFEHFFIDFDTLNNIAVTMDDVLRNIYDYWTPSIDNGISITTSINDNYLAQYGNGVAFKEVNDAGRTHTFQMYYNDGLVRGAYIRSGTDVDLAVYNTTTSPKNMYTIRDNSNYGVASVSARSHRTQTTFYLNNNTYPDVIFPDLNSFLAWASSLDPENLPANNSPDLVNPNAGSLNKNNKDDLEPSIEQGKAMRPIPKEAYNNWVETNNLAEPAEKGALLGALVAPYIETEPAPAPSPAPDDPWADPVPDTEPALRPVSPDQPEFPDEPELTDEQVNESLLGATPDLTEIFPFCIPWDIARILKHFTANRKAPYIEWTFESDLFGFSYTFELDLAIFDDVAVVLRLLELAGFILGLAILTRYLIGAS